VAVGVRGCTAAGTGAIGARAGQDHRCGRHRDGIGITDAATTDGGDTPIGTGHDGPGDEHDDNALDARTVQSPRHR